MSTISVRLPANWGVNQAQTIDDALVAKRCKDLVSDVSGALNSYADFAAPQDNQAEDYCPEINRVIMLGVSQGRVASHLDLTFNAEKTQVLEGEVRTENNGYKAISKVEQNGDPLVFTRQIDGPDGNSPSNYQSEEQISVQVNPDGTLTLLQDQGQPPANLEYYTKALHCKSGN